MAVSGGTGPFSFSIKSGTRLPTGLSLNSSSGAITGTPTAAGSSTFTIIATDSLGDTATKSYTVVINSPPSITPTSLSNWDADLANYKQSVTGKGGTGSLTFSIESGTSLPTGLSLNISGVITGTPTTAGSYTFLVVVTDSVGDTATQPYTVVINSAPTITPTSLPNWDKSLAGYKQTVAASGGTGTLTLSLKSGTSLPTGLASTAGTGVISGTPTAAGTFTFDIVATDSVGDKVTQAYTVVISSSPRITTTSLSNWDANLANYNQTVAVSGGTGPFSFSIKSGTRLPTGLSLNSSSRAITGTPTVAGSSTFTVVATDSLGDAATKSYTVVINSPPSITTTSLSNWDANLANYKQSVAAKGGTGNALLQR